MGNVGCAEQDSGPQIRLLEARLGRPSWCSTLGERRRSLRAESLRLRTSGALSQGHMRAAGSIPGGLWPSFPERRAADLATALARTPPGLQPNLTLLGADVPCQAPPNPLPAMPGLESQSKHQQGPSCLLIFHCTPRNTHTPRAPCASTTLGAQRYPECLSRGQREAEGNQKEDRAEARAAGRRPVARRTPTSAQCEPPPRLLDSAT